MADSSYDRGNQIAVLALMALGCLLLLFVVRKIRDTPRKPDPWDDEIAAALDDENAEPLCIHCLTPHNLNVDFCPHCGAPVGDLTNYMPLESCLSLGYVWRIGADGDFKKTPGTVAFFFLAAFRGSLLLVPFYWLRVLTNLGRPQESPPSDADTRH